MSDTTTHSSDTRQLDELGLDPLLPAKTVRQYLGNISDMTLWRWERERGFPEPTRIGRFKYWRRGEIDAWLEQQKQAA